MHRHGIEDGIIRYEGSLRQRGQIFALVALVVLLAAVAWLAYLGFGQSAAALGTATIVGVVGVFATGRYFDAAESRLGAPRSSDKARTSGAPQRRKR